MWRGELWLKKTLIMARWVMRLHHDSLTFPANSTFPFDHRILWRQRIWCRRMSCGWWPWTLLPNFVLLHIAEWHRNIPRSMEAIYGSKFLLFSEFFVQFSVRWTWKQPHTVNFLRSHAARSDSLSIHFPFICLPNTFLIFTSRTVWGVKRVARPVRLFLLLSFWRWFN